MNSLRNFAYGALIGFVSIPMIYTWKARSFNQIKRLSLGNAYSKGIGQTLKKNSFLLKPVLYGGIYGVTYSLFFRGYWDHINMHSSVREILGHSIFFSFGFGLISLRYTIPGLVVGILVGFLIRNEIL